MAKVTKIGVETRMFDGLSRVIFFKDFDLAKLSETTTLAEILAAGHDLGQIVEGSPSWDGDDVEVNTLKNTEGGAIRSVTTPGTLAWSCRIPHSKETALLVGATEMEVTSLGDGFQLAEGKKVIGVNPSDLIHQCPVGVLNLTRNELSLFPKGSVSFAMTIEDDDLWQYTVNATADEIDTANLKTMMFIPLGEDPLKDDAAA